MSFLNTNNSEFLTARITQKGRKAIAQGNFIISKFQIGDSEFDYNFTGYTGTGSTPSQKVLSPMDKDAQVKYPLNYSGGTVPYGQPISQEIAQTIHNNMGPAGFVSDYSPFNVSACTGTTIYCPVQEIPLTSISGTTGLTVNNGAVYNKCQYITVLFNTRTACTDYTLTGNTTSLVYKIMNASGITSNVIYLDRPLPNLTGLTGYAQVICNDCNPELDRLTTDPACAPAPTSPKGPHDPWQMDIVWTNQPAGLQGTNEYISGYTGTQYASTKQYLGYTTTSGQTWTNFTGGTITGATSYTNSMGDNVVVTPEEQKTIAIIHYSKLGDGFIDHERYFKYDDYIAADTNGVANFEVYIPFLIYHRNTGTTIGATFTMGATDYYVSSTMNLYPNSNNVVFRYLLDEQGNKVGKVFTGKKIVVIDDQEIVAALDYRSNRKYTLPAPRVAQVPIDLPCTPAETPLVTSGHTAYVTYYFENTSDEALTGLHCNYYSKIVANADANVSLKFNSSEFAYFSRQSINLGFNKFYALVQVVSTNTQPSPDGWKKIDLTSLVPNGFSLAHLAGSQYVINETMFNAAGLYNINSGNLYREYQPLNTDPIGLPEFGDAQPFPGSVKVVRATDLEVMTMMINLPSGTFTSSQNPTYKTGYPVYVTEIALLDSNNNPLAMAKTAKPIKRTGAQVFAVKLDF
jgi:hypothetical protein